MGQEIPTATFDKNDFDAFDVLLHDETRALGLLFDEHGFSTRNDVVGFELEAWLVDSHAHPAPVNNAYLDRLNNPLVVPELAAFNIEINNRPHTLRGDVLRRMHQELNTTLQECRTVAGQLDADIALIGILPSVLETELCRQHMSDLTRYIALNEQVLRYRGGKPLHLDIDGHEHLLTDHADVMLEAATTSFQIHLKVGQDDAVRAYNAAQIISAPMVAACANSPYLFGMDLWDETRIPVFEQSVNLGQGHPQRVTFGSGYAKESLFECFTENVDRFCTLLPISDNPDGDPLSHLRMHNGTIWRWNRPLVGFDNDGTPHLRIEHRVIPSGPSLPDTIANAALFFGLVYYFSGQAAAPETQLPFNIAKNNFYAAARNGLSAQLTWLDGTLCNVKDLLIEQLIPAAREGLASVGIDDSDIDYYLGIIAARVSSGRNGAHWQRTWVARHGTDMQDLCLSYIHQQHRNIPVHEWPC